jgi:5-formyltetrahydrofolate cyclo-ligase
MDTKDEIRERVWRTLEKEKVALFPGARGRIPNFKGAERAARLLLTLLEWQRAEHIKANPDSPQKPVRYLALSSDKTIYMAVPRLREKKCFIKLDPSKISPQKFHEASSIKGAFRYGIPVHPKEIPQVDTSAAPNPVLLGWGERRRSVSTLSKPWALDRESRRVDLIVAGSVAVNRRGIRMGKGGGYSDLEYAIGREFGFVKEDVVIVTTVHPLQIMDGDLPETDHDFRIDFIRLRRRPRLRAETVASMGAFGEDMHFGVQARALPADECELRS